MHAQTEKKLALERNVLRTVTDNIPDSIFAKDPQGRYLLANKAFAAVHGVKSPDELLGKTAFDLFPKERATALHADDLQVMRTGGAVSESERTAQDADGNVKVLHTTKVPLIDKNENVVGIVGVHRDITRRKEAEQKLRQSEANLAAAQRIAHFGSVELDLVDPENPEKNPVRGPTKCSGFLDTSPAWTQPSRARAFFRIVHPDEKDEVRQSLDYALREAKPYAIDFRIIRPDGAERNIHERGDIIFDPKTHQPLKLVGSVQDVTERVQAEIQLQQANAELAEKVQELEQRSKEIHLLSDMGSRLQTYKDCDRSLQRDRQCRGATFSQAGRARSASPVLPEPRWKQFPTGERASEENRVFAPDDCWALRRASRNASGTGRRTAPCRHIDAGRK